LRTVLLASGAGDPRKAYPEKFVDVGDQEIDALSCINADIVPMVFDGKISCSNPS
jgi:hypothetical protein